jgi:hypothetical protein
MIAEYIKQHRDMTTHYPIQRRYFYFIFCCYATQAKTSINVDNDKGTGYIYTYEDGILTAYIVIIVIIEERQWPTELLTIHGEITRCR